MPTRIPPRPVPPGGRLKAAPEMPAMGKEWLAYRIKGSRSEKYDGVIRAHTREEAEVKAQVAFGCRTDAERRRVYVREL
jgi:hypothetical protein